MLGTLDTQVGTAPTIWGKIFTSSFIIRTYIYFAHIQKEKMLLNTMEISDL